MQIINSPTGPASRAPRWWRPRRSPSIGGEDGTLGSRFSGHPEARNIRAKTGTLDHVRAISGYVESPEHGRVAFSFLVNNFEGPGAGVTAILDQLALALLQ